MKYVISHGDLDPTRIFDVDTVQEGLQVGLYAEAGFLLSGARVIDILIESEPPTQPQDSKRCPDLYLSPFTANELAALRRGFERAGFGDRLDEEDVYMVKNGSFLSEIIPQIGETSELRLPVCAAENDDAPQQWHDSYQDMAQALLGFIEARSSSPEAGWKYLDSLDPRMQGRLCGGFTDGTAEMALFVEWSVSRCPSISEEIGTWEQTVDQLLNYPKCLALLLAGNLPKLGSTPVTVSDFGADVRRRLEAINRCLRPWPGCVPYFTKIFMKENRSALIQRYITSCNDPDIGQNSYKFMSQVDPEDPFALWDAGALPAVSNDVATWSAILDAITAPGLLSYLADKNPAAYKMVAQRLEDIYAYLRPWPDCVPYFFDVYYRQSGGVEVVARHLDKGCNDMAVIDNRTRFLNVVTPFLQKVADLRMAATAVSSGSGIPGWTAYARALESLEGMDLNLAGKILDKIPGGAVDVPVYTNWIAQAAAGMETKEFREMWMNDGTAGGALCRLLKRNTQGSDRLGDLIAYTEHYYGSQESMTDVGDTGEQGHLLQDHTGQERPNKKARLLDPDSDQVPGLPAPDSDQVPGQEAAPRVLTFEQARQAVVGYCANTELNEHVYNGQDYAVSLHDLYPHSPALGVDTAALGSLIAPAMQKFGDYWGWEIEAAIPMTNPHSEARLDVPGLRLMFDDGDVWVEIPVGWWEYLTCIA